MEGSRAATLALRGFGAEIFGYLVASHRDEEDAAEVFALFSARLWRDLPTFRGDSSFRTWAYVLARHASLNYRRTHAGSVPLRPKGTPISKKDPYVVSVIYSGLRAMVESMRLPGLFCLVRLQHGTIPLVLKEV